MSGEAIARALGKDGGTVRRRVRQLRGVIPKPPIKGIAVFDLHYPDHHSKFWQNILRYTADLKPDVFVFGGDNLDCSSVSHWVENKSRKVEGKRMKKDYDGFNRDVLSPLACILPDGARRIFHLGNHEDWVEQYIDVHPEVEGFLEVRANLHLEGWEVFDYGHASQVGKLFFTHGDYCNEHVAKKVVQTYHRNVVFGHVHTYQSFTETTPLDSDSHTATAIGCACHMNPHYARNKPNRWLNQFAVFHVAQNGNYNPFPVTAIDGCFTAPDGRRYE